MRAMSIGATSLWVLAWVGIAAGVAFLWLALRPEAISFGASSSADVVLGLIAGGSTIAVGLECMRRSPDDRLGLLLTLAGFAWFVIGWSDPASGVSIVFTIGLVGRAAYAPLVAHAALAFPDGQLRGRREAVVLGVGYVAALLLIGLIPALLFVADAEGCYGCPNNMLAVTSETEIASGVSRLGLLLGAAWSVVIVAMVGRRLTRATPAGRLVEAPVLVPATVFAALFGLDALHSLSRGALGTDQADLWLWRLQAVALIAVAIGVVTQWVRARRTRARVARLVIELADSPRPGGLRDVLAKLVGDPDLVLAYPLADGRWVDANGGPALAEALPDRLVTPLRRGGEVVALLDHRRGIGDDRAQMEELVRAARLGLESERLQAEARATLEDLRASRARVVEANDEERKRLERDLHDGAQQRLVSLAVAIRLLRAQLGSLLDPSAAEALDHVQAELAAAVSELRTLAHGLYPAVLADEGLAAGVEAFVEGSDVPVSITAMPTERLDSSVETAAYLLVAEAIRNSGARRAEVSAIRLDNVLVVEVLEEGGRLPSLPELEDRIAALNGTMVSRALAGQAFSVRAEIPCGS